MVSRGASKRPWQAAAGIAAVLALLALGGWLRAVTWPWHSNLWAIDWLSYYEPQADALRHGRLHAWLLSWEGLHPPVSGVVHGTLMALGVPLLGHWVATVLAGGAGVLLLSRAVVDETPRAQWIGLILLGWASLSPLQANYGLNTSPYPWALLLVGASVLALQRAAEGPVHRRPYVIAAVLVGLALQTHVLAFAVALGQGLWLLAQGRQWIRERRDPLLRWAGLVALFTVPLVIGSLTKTSDPWTFHIEAGEEHWSRTAWMVLHERFGARPTGLALGALVTLLGAAGLVLRPRGLPGMLFISLLGWCSALVLFIELGVADPRLSHYYLVPHLLGLAAGAAGAGAIVDRVPLAQQGRVQGGLALIMLATSVPWAHQALDQQLHRRSVARDALATAAAERSAVRAAFADAAEGDVVAYLWDHEFLNDEPEYLDPFAAWPLGRVGRSCPEEHPPRSLCNVVGSGRFYFDPSSFSGALYELEEPLRMMVNQAEPPGRARILLVPSPHAPPRPFPTEVWMESKGGVARHPGPGVTVWEFPVGTRIEPPTEMLEPPPPRGSE